MAKVIIRDGQIVSQDGTQLKFESTPISGTTAEFTSITAGNLYGNGSNLDNVVKTTNVNQTIDGTKTFLNDIIVNDLIVGKSGQNELIHNTAVGVGVLPFARLGISDSDNSQTDGDYNTGFGYNSLNQIKNGVGNVGIGYESLRTGDLISYNTAIGYEAGYSLTSGQGNVFLGLGAGRNETSINNTIILGTGYYINGYGVYPVERLRIDSNGNVAINSTTANGYRLFVNGTFRATYANLDGAYVGNNGIEVNGDINANGNIYGDGSNLDNVNAILLNSQPGSYYLDYANFTGTPPSPNDSTITISAGDGLQTGGDFTTNQTINETITLDVDSTVVRTSGDQTIAGIKTFSSTIVGNITGNSGTSTKLATARTISLSGDISGFASFDGSADVTISSDLSSTGVSAGTYRSVTVDAKGRVTAGTNPTSSDEYGLTDVVKTTNVDQTIYGIKNFSNSLGIGTSSPGSYSVGATKLVVADSTDHVGITLHSNPASQGRIYFGDALTTGVASRQGQIVYDHNTDNMFFATTYAERIRISNTGNVSINDTSAYGYRLFVNGSFKASSVYSPYASLDEIFVGSNGIEVDGDINANGNIYGDGSTLNNVVKTTNVNQNVDGTKTFLNDTIVNDLTVGKGNSNFITNTVLGQEALTAATTYTFGEGPSTQNRNAEYNVAVGYRSIKNNQKGRYTVAVGYDAGVSLTTGDSNTFIGSRSGDSVTSGIGNTLIGANAGGSITSGHCNIAIGLDSGISGTGDENVFIGYRSGFYNNGSNNLFLGSFAGNSSFSSFSDTTIISNGWYKERLRIDSSGKVSINDTSAYGYDLYVNGTFKASTSIDSPYANFDEVLVGLNGIEVDGDINANGNIYGDGSTLNNVVKTTNVNQTIDGTKTFLNTIKMDSSGFYSVGLMGASGAYSNSVLGYLALQNTTTGMNNVSIGPYSLRYNVIGNDNIAIGSNALQDSTQYKNIGIGKNALTDLASGNANVALGYYAGAGVTGGSNNVFIGPWAGYNDGTLSDTIIFAVGQSSERMRIDSTGNVGIGTTITSGYKLTVNGSAKFNNDMLLLGQLDVSDQIITDTGFVGDGWLITNINSNNIDNNGRFVTIAGEETITGDKVFSSDVRFSSDIRVNNSITVGSGLYSSDNNTAVGANTLVISGHSPSIANSGEHNTAIGKNALMHNTTGYFNTGIGSNALNFVSTGYGNVALGYAAGNEISTGTNNIFIGTGAGYGLETSTDSIVIGGYDFSSQTGASLNKTVIISDGQNLRYTYGTIIDNQARHILWGKGTSSDTSYPAGSAPYLNLHYVATSYPSPSNYDILGSIEFGATVSSEAKFGGKIVVTPQTTWSSGNQKASNMLFYVQDGTTTDTTNIFSGNPALKLHGGNKVSINSISADSTLHVYDGISGTTPFSSTGITVESNASSYINMIAPSSGLAQITFGDNSNSDFGYLRCDFTSEEVSLGLRGNQSKLFINPYTVAVAGTNPGNDTSQRLKVDGPASIERVLTIDSTDVGAQNAYIFFKNVSDTSSTNNLSMGFDKSNYKFHIYKGAFGSTTPLMTITSDYKIGFGDSAPTYQLEVNNRYSSSDSVLNISKTTSNANAYTRYEIDGTSPVSYEVGAFWHSGTRRFKIRNSQYDILSFTGTSTEIMGFATIDSNSLNLGGDPGYSSPKLWIQAPGSNTYTFAEDSHSDIIVKGDDAHMQLISYGSGYGSAYFLSTAQGHWAMYQHAADVGKLRFGYKGTAASGQYNLISSISEKGYITNATNVSQIDFTGQHRSHVSEGNLTDYDDKTGLIVASSGEYENFNNAPITINEALPKVKLTNTRNQKSVFGVISDSEDENNEQREYVVGNFVSTYEKATDDNRLIINSLGEGGIWVTNVNGNLENGDYITTCEIPGYGMKQDSEFLANYTVAKITCDCDFDLNSSIYICKEFQWEGQTYRRAFVGCTYHCG